MQFRPAGLPPLVASDQVYDAPGKDWDGQETKIEPGAGEIASGAVPEQPIDAEVSNYYANDTAKRLRAVDLIEVQNWPEPAPEAGVYTAGGNAPGIICEALVTRRLYTIETNDEDIALSDDGGYTWTTDYTSAGNDFKALAGGTISVLASLDDTGTGKVAQWTTTQAWTEDDFSAYGATEAPSVIVWDRWLERYLIGGLGGADGAMLLSMTEGNMPNVPDDHSPLVNGDGLKVEWIAPGENLVLFANTDAVYTWDKDVATPSTGTRTWLIDGTASGYTMRSLVHDEVSGYWYALIRKAANPTRVYESVDGVTWTRKGASDTILANLDVSATNALACRGGALLFAGELGGVPVLIYSGDRGETWQVLHDPLGRHGTQTQVIGVVGGRFAAWSYRGTGERVHAFALRMG